MMLEGISELPLHQGHVPAWLANIMKRLAKAILEIMVEEFGPDKIVERFSNPLWFQAFNNVIGMDWDSSGSTTVTTGILKEVSWNNPDLGFLVLGGKGRYARQVPEEIPYATELLGINSDTSKLLEKASRIIAKVDSVMLQDNYTLYHHALFVSENGVWAIIQQGMNLKHRMARRYHWFQDTSFYEDPHKAVAGIKHDLVLNLVSRESRKARKTILDLAKENPNTIINEYSSLFNKLKGQREILSYITPSRTGRIKLERINKIIIYEPLPLPKHILEKLRRTYEVQPGNLDDLLLIRGVGPKTIRALALMSDLIYNEPPSTNDPVNTPYDPFKYAYAIGGKDGVPYPVNKKDAEEVIATLEDIIYSAKIGRKEKLLAMKKLSKIKIRFRIVY
ncbi:protein of unknown function DUF763 [Staphylothermus marinus F1]|uniref:DUF763 domain-containing protein n=1 Tax=Staphylothermus marinus (strain ATCC 43588 / DSM 3639 / JCM 9404 / F1) TaxID=399550 RepID=A3DKN2_STAMF|nr:DUF763 domain-containing protein [Staphylothermus marinus]ABN69192.1 protein of unknown function DUF763 [Staphylothermus marinus F1]